MAPNTSMPIGWADSLFAANSGLALKRAGAMASRVGLKAFAQT